MSNGNPQITKYLYCKLSFFFSLGYHHLIYHLYLAFTSKIHFHLNWYLILKNKT